MEFNAQIMSVIHINNLLIIYDEFLQLYLLLSIINMIFSILASRYKAKGKLINSSSKEHLPEEKLSSIFIKTPIAIVVALIIDLICTIVLKDDGRIRDTIYVVLTLSELVSIVEYAEILGVKFPPVIKKFIHKIADERGSTLDHTSSNTDIKGQPPDDTKDS